MAAGIAAHRIGASRTMVMMMMMMMMFGSCVWLLCICSSPCKPDKLLLYYCCSAAYNV